MDRVSFSDSFTIGVHSSRPDSVSCLELNHPMPQSSQTKGLLYSTGQEIRVLEFDEDSEIVNHVPFSVESQHHTGCVACICIARNHIVTCDFDGEIILWDRITRQILDTLDLTSQQFSYATDLFSLQLADLDLKSKQLSVTDKYVAVALEGVFRLILLEIENGNRLTFVSTLSTCVEFIRFLQPLSNSENSQKIELMSVCRNIPPDVAKGMHTPRDMDPFGCRIEFYDFQELSGTDFKWKPKYEIFLEVDQKLGLVCCCEGFCALMYRSSRKIALVDLKSHSFLTVISWQHLGNGAPMFYDNILKLVISAGVLMCINPANISNNEVSNSNHGRELVINLPTKQYVRAGKAVKEEFWKEFEKDGIQFEFISEDVADVYVALKQISNDFVVVFTQYEIVVSKIARVDRNSSFGAIDRRCLFNITCIGCASNCKYVAAGDFSGQIVVSDLDRSAHELASQNASSSEVKDGAVGVNMKCNGNIHGLYSAEESVRSLRWHPSYEEVLFMGLFNSTLVFVDVQSDHCVPVQIDNISSGAITCLKWSLPFFPTANEQKNYGQVYSQFGSEVASSSCFDHAAAILLVGTTSGHVVLYRHDFCFNRKELMNKFESSESGHIDGGLFVASFTKLTTFLAHHPIAESNDNFGSLGHFAEVWSCAWTPIGHPLSPQHFVTCSEDQQVRVWSLNSEIAAAKAADPDTSFDERDDGEGEERASVTENKPVSSPVYVLTGHRFAVTCLDWQLLELDHSMQISDQTAAEDGISNPEAHISFLCSCSDDKSIRVYRVCETFRRLKSDVNKKIELEGSERRVQTETEDVQSCEIEFNLVILLSTSFLADWHTLTYTCLQSTGSHLAVVTQHGYLLVFSLSQAEVVSDVDANDVWEFVHRPQCCVFCKKVANGSLEGLSWSGNNLCMSSADCCLNVKSIQFN